jgi:hypothetical protein
MQLGYNNKANYSLDMIIPIIKQPDLCITACIPATVRIFNL